MFFMSLFWVLTTLKCNLANQGFHISILHLSLLQLPLHALAPSPPNVVGTGHLPELVFDLVATLLKPICFTHVNITKKLNYIQKKGPVSLTASKLLLRSIEELFRISITKLKARVQINRQRRNKQNFKSILPKTHLKYHTLIKEKYIYIKILFFPQFFASTK